MSRNELGQGLLQTGGSSTITQNFNNHYAAAAAPRLSLLEALQFSELGHRERTVEAAQDQTCTWLLDTEEYREWVLSEQVSSAEHRLLWIKAKAGAGKSTLIRFAIKQARQAADDTSSSEEIEPPSKRQATTDIRDERQQTNSIPPSPDLVLSHFFNARGNILERSTEGLYRTLLVQLLQRLPHLSAALSRINDGWQPVNGKSWPVANLTELLQCAIRRLKDHTVVLFVDALDECNEDEVREMVNIFTSLIEGSVSSQQNLRVCFASRPWPDIKADKALYINLNHHKAHHQDIKHYINAQLRIGTGLQADSIRSRLLENSRGVFLWVKLVVMMLNKEYDRGRLENLEKRLQGTHGDLEALYLEMLERYQDDQDESDMRIQVLCFQWVLSVVGDLKPVELWWGIQLGLGHDIDAIKERSEEIDEATIARYIGSASKGLVECVDPMSSYRYPVVQFIHESARQFVAGDRGCLRQVVGQSHQDAVDNARVQLQQCCFRLLEDVWRHADASARFTWNNARMRLPLFEHARNYTLVYAEKLQRAGVEQGHWLAGLQQRNDGFSVFLSPMVTEHLYRPASLLNVLIQHNSVTLLKANWTSFIHDARIAREQRHLLGLQDGHDIGCFSWMTYSLYKGAQPAISCVLDLYMGWDMRHESVQDLLQQLRLLWDENYRTGASGRVKRKSYRHRRRYTLPMLSDRNDELATFILVAATPANVNFSGSAAESLQSPSPPTFVNATYHILKLGLPNDYFDTAKGSYRDLLDWAEVGGHWKLAATISEPRIRARFKEPHRIGELST